MGKLQNMLSAEAAATTQQMGVFQHEYSKRRQCRINLLIRISTQINGLAPACCNTYATALTYTLIHLCKHFDNRALSVLNLFLFNRSIRTCNQAVPAGITGISV